MIDIYLDFRCFYFFLYQRFLEETLSLMKSEFEEKENDWKRKLENERQLHEQKNKENEKKLKKLEMQLKCAHKQLAAVGSQEKTGNDGSNCSIGFKPRKSKVITCNIWGIYKGDKVLKILCLLRVYSYNFHLILT